MQMWNQIFFMVHMFTTTKIQSSGADSKQAQTIYVL